MTMRVRASLMLVIALAVLTLAGCGHYVCQATFGSSTCTGGALTLGQSGGGSANSAFVFAIDTGSGGANGFIDGFTIDTTNFTFQATSGFTPLSIPTNSGGVGMVVAQKQFLYAGIAGQLFGWTIDSSGGLTAISGTPLTAAFLNDFVGGVGEAQMIVNPAGTLLFFAATSTSGIYVYSIGSGGVLTLVPGSPFAVPFGPMNLSTDGLGKYLYTSNGDFNSHTASEIQAYSIGSGGVLTQVGTPLISPMWMLKGESTGQFMIGTSGNAQSFSGLDDTHLYVFTIGSNGALSGPTTVTTVYSPWTIAVQPNSGGSFVYSFSFNDTDTAFNPPEGFQITSAGGLQMDANSPFINLTNGSWGQLDQSGSLVLDWASYFNSSTNATVTTLSPFEVGSGGVLTQPIATLTLNSPGFWVVTDPQ